MFTLDTGSIFGPVRKSIRYNVNDARGNAGVEIGTVWSWAIHIVPDRYVLDR